MDKVLGIPPLTERQRNILGDAATEQLVAGCEQDRTFLVGLCLGIVSRMSPAQQAAVIADDPEQLIGVLGFDPEDPQPWGKDQYGDVVPYDLVVLFWREWQTDDETKETLNANWYEAEGNDCILVSADAVSYEMPYEPKEFDIHPGTQINQIADCLHRFNKEDGFYHA